MHGTALMTASYMFEPDHANAEKSKDAKKGYVALKMLQVSFTAAVNIIKVLDSEMRSHSKNL